MKKVKSLELVCIIDEREILPIVKSYRNNKMKSKKIIYDREVMLEAVKSDEMALEYVSNTLKSDREVILEASKSSHGNAIEYVTHLDNDESIDDKTIIKSRKYKGFSAYEIAEFDHAYLEWISKNIKDLDSELGVHIE